MVIVSAGMRKAGSAWYYNLTNDLLQAGGYVDVREVAPHFPVRAYVSDDKIKCGRLDGPTLVRLSIAHYLGYTYPVKTHSRPSRALPLFHTLGAVRCTYISRDPRDVVVSILDHAEHARRAGLSIDLAALQTFQESVDLVVAELDRWEAWAGQRVVHHVRYEDLVANTAHEIDRLDAFLGLEVPVAERRAIAARYERTTYAHGMGEAVTNPIHLNKGVAGRFKEVLDDDEIGLCNSRFAPYLTRMGYA